MRLTNNGIPLFVCLSISSFVCLFVFFFFLGTAPVSCHPYTLPIHFWNIGCRGFFFFTRRRKKTNTRTHTQKKNKFRSDPRFCQDVHNSQVLFCLVWSSFFFVFFVFFWEFLGNVSVARTPPFPLLVIDGFLSVSEARQYTTLLLGPPC